jgi:hypothetical protein
LPGARFTPQTTAAWVNPRTNQGQPARPTANDAGQIEIAPPEAGDWLLILKHLVNSSEITTDAKKLR